MVFRLRLHGLATALILLTIVPVGPVKSQSQGVLEEARASVQVISSEADSITLEMTAPVYQQQIVEIGARSYTALEVPGAQLVVDPHQWQLPVLNATIGVPPDSNLELTVIYDEVEHPESTVVLEPIRKYTPPEDVFPADEQIPQDFLEPFTSQSIVPDAPVQIREAWLRDQHIATLTFYPLQYLPAEEALVWHKTLQVQVRFVKDASIMTRDLSARDQSPDFEALYRSTLLNYEQALAWRAQPVPENYTLQRVEAPLEVTGPRYRIVVDRDGVYRITYAQLQALGMDVGNVNPSHFNMTSQGLDVAIYVDGYIDGSFDPGDSIIFYGQRFRGDVLAARYASEGSSYLTYARQLSDGTYTTWSPQFNATMMEKYTKENVYWLQIGQSDGLRMATLDGTPDSPTYLTTESYTTTVRAEQSNYWYTFNFSSEDTMYWDWITDTNQRIYTTTLTALATAPFSATLRGEITSRSANIGVNPDHHTRIWLNNTGSLVDDTKWDGISRYHFEKQIPDTFLQEGQNDLLFSQVTDLYSGQNPDQIYFDWFEIQYDRLFQAQGNHIAFERMENSQTWRYSIGNFSGPSVEVYEISNPLTPRRVLIPGYQNGTVTFESNLAGKAAYTAYGTGAISNPKSITFYDPPDLKSPSLGADYLIITHASLLTAVQALANYRSSQGLETMVVDVADVYNEFNDGIFHSIAIKNFLRYAYENWEKRPTYVLLVGDGHWDFFDSTYYNPTPLLLPPHLAWIDPWQGEVDSSSLLASVAGLDILPDMFVARIPVNDVPQLDVVINKIKTYESGSLQDWQRHILYIADQPDEAGNFEAYANHLAQDYHPTGFINDLMFTEDIGCGETGLPACAPEIINQLKTPGALLMSYIGHGAINNWGGRIFRATDIPGLGNGTELPVLLSMTCLDGYSFKPADSLQDGQGLVESLLRVADKGIVASFSPTGLGVATGHDLLQRGFYDTLFEDGVWVLGQAALSAKLNLFNAAMDDDLIQTYTIFGDPALRIHNPYGIPQVAPTSAVDAGIAGSIVTYPIQVTNTGSVSDMFAASVTGNLWQVTAPTTAPVLPGNTTTLNVSVQIPPGAGIDAVDDANVLIYSKGDISKTRSLALTTLVGNITITPPSSFIRTSPGQLVVHNFTITNSGRWQETYRLSKLDWEWSTLVSPVTTSPLAPGAGTGASVTVFVPSSPNAALDISRLRVASMTYPSLWKDVTITTSVADLLFLPGLFH